MMPRPCRFTTQIPMIDKRTSKPIVFHQPIALATQIATPISMIGTAIRRAKNTLTTLSAGHRSYARRRARQTSVDRRVGPFDRGRRAAAAAARRRRSRRGRGERSRLGESACRGDCACVAAAGDQRDRCAAPHEPRARSRRVAAGRRVLEPRARPRFRPSRLTPRARSSPHRSRVRRRGRDGREQRRFGRAPRPRGCGAWA